MARNNTTGRRPGRSVECPTRYHSEVVLDVFGPAIGEHARTAIGVAALPLNLPVVVAAELQITTPPH